jgi:ketosteroid isomerase-like protein
MRKFAAGNASGLATLYSPDGKLLPTHSGLVEGRLAIQNFWQSVMDLGARHARLQTLELKRSGDSAYESGVYTLCDAQDQVLDQGTYMVIWKRCDGEWSRQLSRFRRSLGTILQPDPSCNLFP